MHFVAFACLWFVCALLVPYAFGTCMGILVCWPNREGGGLRPADAVIALVALGAMLAGLVLIEAHWSLVIALCGAGFGFAVAERADDDSSNPCLVTHIVASLVCPAAGRMKYPYRGWYRN